MFRNPLGIRSFAAPTVRGGQALSKSCSFFQRLTGGLRVPTVVGLCCSKQHLSTRTSLHITADDIDPALPIIRKLP